MSIHVVDRLEAAARAYPDNIAIDEGADCTMTYGRFMHRVNRLAHVIREHAARRVLIYLPKMANAYAAMFATLKAGGFYTPVNHEISVERIRHVVNTLEPELIFTTRDLADHFAHKAGTALEYPVAFVEDIAEDGPTLQVAEQPHHLAYTKFTSGSTGVPKGVMISQKALHHYLDWVFDRLRMTPQDRCSQHPNLGFDVSVTDIYGALCSGATLVIIKSEMDRLFPARAIRERRITVWNSVPSIVSLMMRSNQVTSDNLASLRLFNFLGEPLLKEHLDAIFAARPDLAVINTYGPTEATVACTELLLTRQNYEQYCLHNVSIGQAIPGMQLHLVGGAHEDEGELVITGPQLAEGYMKNEEKTAEAFRTLPGTGERAYYTGDWATRKDGNIYFATRIDFQVKIRGHRLELGEVDAALRKAGLTNVATIAHEGELISFVEGRPQPLEDPTVLREQLGNYLEAYAIPSRFVLIDSLPRNANDKIDIKALAKLYAEGAYAGCEEV